MVLPGLTRTTGELLKMLQMGWLPPQVSDLYIWVWPKHQAHWTLPRWLPAGTVGNQCLVAGWASLYSFCIPAFSGVCCLQVLVLLGCCVMNRLALGSDFDLWFSALLGQPVYVNSTFQKRLLLFPLLVSSFLFPLYYHCSALLGRSIVSPPDLGGTPQSQPLPRALYCSNASGGWPSPPGLATFRPVQCQFPSSSVNFWTAHIFKAIWGSSVNLNSFLTSGKFHSIIHFFSSSIYFFYSFFC